MFGCLRTYLERISDRSNALCLPLFACLLLVTLAGTALAAPVQANDLSGRPLFQDSPLSPLAAPVTAVPAEPATTPPISLVLVGIVLVGVLFVVGLVSWRR